MSHEIIDKLDFIKILKTALKNNVRRIRRKATH